VYLILDYILTSPSESSRQPSRCKPSSQSAQRGRARRQVKASNSTADFLSGLAPRLSTSSSEGGNWPQGPVAALVSP